MICLCCGVDASQKISKMLIYICYLPAGGPFGEKL